MCIECDKRNGTNFFTKGMSVKEKREELEETNYITDHAFVAREGDSGCDYPGCGLPDFWHAKKQEDLDKEDA